MEVTWDEAKNRANVTKHGLSFEEASRLFTSGMDYLELSDERHSEDEERFIALVPVNRGVVLVVWTEEDEDVLRIISARPATRREREHYEAFLGKRR